jgi:hypothetical protein
VGAVAVVLGARLLIGAAVFAGPCMAALAAIFLLRRLVEVVLVAIGVLLFFGRECWFS